MKHSGMPIAGINPLKLKEFFTASNNVSDKTRFFGILEISDFFFEILDFFSISNLLSHSNEIIIIYKYYIFGSFEFFLSKFYSF